MTPAAAERPRLSFFVPAHNEAPNIEATVETAIRELTPLVDSLEMIVVDDGSTDGTGELADALAARDGRVRVVHQAQRGYGGALRAGFEAARGELVAFSDSDLQFDLAEVGLLLERLDAPGRAVDGVIGYRVRRSDPPHRQFIAKTYNAVIATVFGLRVRDIDCAMKLFRREVFDGLPLTTDSPFLSAELLIKLRGRGARLAQIGVNHYPRQAGTNTGASFRKILRTLRDIARLRFRLWFDRRAALGR